MAILYPSHSGRLAPVSGMPDRHLAAALTRLRAEAERLSRMIAGIDPIAAKAWRKQMECLHPAFTLAEALERTRSWIAILQDEQETRERIRWPEIFNCDEKD